MEARSLAQFSDEQIAVEYHRRQMAKLGDQRIGIELPIHLHPRGIPYASGQYEGLKSILEKL